MKPRRWLRFSLRTMFLLLTVLSVWLGWNLNRVRQRERLLSLAGVYKFDGGPLSRGLKNARATAPRVPVVWSWLGAKHVGLLYLDRYRITDPDFEHYRAMFPEANLCAGYIVVVDNHGLTIEVKPRSRRPLTAGHLPSRYVP